MGTFLIYKATNSTNGKSYVGKTSSSLKHRRSGHHATARMLKPDATVFHKALMSYGVDNFMWEILEECVGHDHLNERESHHIAASNCLYPNGYNMTAGGDGMHGYTLHKEVKERISKKIVALHKDPDYRARNYPKLKGLVPPNKGVSPTEEVRARAAAARKAVYDNPSYVNPNVGMKRTGEALDNLHKSYALRELPTGDAWTASHGDQYTNEVRAKMRAAKLGKKPSNTKKVQCIETGEIFDGLTDASKALSVNRQSIFLQIKGKLKKAGGKTFRYVE